MFSGGLFFPFYAFFFFSLYLMCSVVPVSVINIIGPLKYVRLLVDLVVGAQNDVEEQCADVDSQEIKDVILHISSSGEISEDLEWRQELLSGQADVHQFVGEQNVLGEGGGGTVGHIISEISQSMDFFFLYFRPSYQLL
jgi:hypothetical protein